jgi:tetratricopeptide (TPR) repeat protein
MNERFIFIPSIAFSLVCAWTLVQYGWHSTKPLLKWGSVALLVIMASGYAFKTYVRVPAWKDALSLNSSAVMVSDQSARANCFMATALYELGRTQTDPAEKRKIFEEAEFYVDRSLVLYPAYHSANQMKSGFVAENYMVHKNLPRLLNEFTRIIEISPRVEYIQQFMDYLNNREDVQLLTNFYYHVGYEILSVQKGLHPLGITYLKLGEKIAPQDPRILFGLGKALYNGGDQVQGQQYLNRAYALNPALRGQG